MIPLLYDNTYVNIDMDAILANFDAVQSKTRVPIMAIIKADAYGHGAVQIARLLEPKVAFFGVSGVGEALELRQSGLEKPILILGHTPTEAYPQIIALGIRPAIFCREDAELLSQEAQRQHTTAKFHLAVDTGMSRLGFQCTREDAKICAGHGPSSGGSTPSTNG